MVINTEIGEHKKQTGGGGNKEKHGAGELRRVELDEELVLVLLKTVVRWRQLEKKRLHSTALWWTHASAATNLPPE